jgi:hypothetical protein
MGGTGVASARYLSGPLYNPSDWRLPRPTTRFGLLLPVVGA